MRDDGPGLSASQMERLFEPFERLGRETSRIEGTGLGLTLCGLLARSMEDELDVVSAPGAGTDFVQLLPAADPETP